MPKKIKAYKHLTINMMYLDKVTYSNHVKEIKVYKKLSSNSSIFVIRKHIKIFLLNQNIQLTSIFVIKIQAQVSLSLSSTTLDSFLDKVEASSSSSSSTKQKILPFVDVQFCPGYCAYFHFWASGPFVTSFEFWPRTLSVFTLSSL